MYCHDYHLLFLHSRFVVFSNGFYSNATKALAMSIVPNIEDEHGDLCWECGRDREEGECACGVGLPDDFDPLDEESWDPNWDDYEDDLTIGDKDE